MLLLRLVKQQPDDELWFNVEGKLIEFTYNDFCRITGLPVAALRPVVAEDSDNDDEQAEEEEEPGEIANTYFHGSLDITFQMMKEKVQWLGGNKKRNGMLGVKLASLFVVENVLMGRDRTTRINRRSIQLANDFEEFKKEPWSRDAYHLLVTHLKGLLDGQPMKFLDSKANNPEYKNAKFSVYGLPLVLQVWAYEKIPKFGEHFGTRVGNREVPMLNWSCHGKFRSSKIREIVFVDELRTPPSSDAEDEDNIEVETRERVQAMCLDIDEIKSSLQRLDKKVEEELGELKHLLVQVIDTVNKALKEKGGPSAPSELEEQNEVGATDAEGEKSNAVVGEPQHLPEGENSIAVDSDAQNSEIDPVKIVVDELKWESEQSMTCHMYEECHTPTNLLMCLKEVEDDKIPALTVPFESLDWDVVGDDVGTAGVDMKAIEEASMKELRKRKRFKSKYICSPFIAPAAKRLKVGGRDGEYDSFKAWVEEIDGIEPSVLHLDIPSSYPTNRIFF
ncbi:unnamed protein product [Cuscuta europaea]|uniref:DUF1985 domain-containing protein n=1 Tax=Cuscuta europaea TaxID=41803 RepID=A0A9P0ZY08_CUSEU|nr:unnamed protein product [Cuscuta europaea]